MYAINFAFCIVAVSCQQLQAGTLEPSPNTRFVATDGNDAWSGTLPSPNTGRTDGPFASLPRARDELRKRRSANGVPAGATIVVRRGTYSLAGPLTFLPEDSGTEQGPVTFTAAHGEKVVLKGSRPIAGWKRLEDDVWRADLSGFQLGAAHCRQLFFDGKRQPLARVPNFDPEHPRSGGFLYAAGTLQKDDLSPLPYNPWAAQENASKSALLYNPNRFDPTKWSDPSEARVHVWSFLNWNRDICSIRAVDRQKHIIMLRDRARYALIEGNRFFVENVREELDAPGEWHYDEASKQLTFWPPDGQRPENRVSVSILPVLVQFRGDEKASRFVEHICLRGFSLSESEDLLVSLKATAHCTVAACTLSGCPDTALTLSDRSHHNRIAGCDIAHVGGAGIVLEGIRDWSHSLEDHVSHNLISNNHVHHVGEGGNAWGAIRIDPSCGGNCTHDNVISHNLVHDTPRQGITFNGFRNVVEFNHVHHTNQEQSDTGAIGMGSRDVHERGSIIRHNWVHDTGGYCMIEPGEWAYPHYCWGIYLDDYTSGVHVYGNLIVRAHRGGVMVHGGQDNVIENNVIVDCLSQQVEYLPIDDLIRGRTPEHPDKSEWLMTGTKLIANVFAYSDETAHWAKGRQWEQILVACDRNLIWHGGQPVTIHDTTASEPYNWADWRKRGFDANSHIADPLFVDPNRNDYRLQGNSPAFKLGFRPIPFTKIGLRKSPDRASWPLADDCWREEHVLYPEDTTPSSP
jgi:parallel beta helix pectate lyase-like protein